MDAVYGFESRWPMPASPERCWMLLERVLRGGGSWWPGVRVPDPPAHLAAGEVLTFRVRSRLGYVLNMRLRLTDVRPGVRIAATSAGDLAGEGAVEIEKADAAGSLIVIRWQVVTRRRWMNATARVLRPVFVAAHDRVMRDGEQAMRAALASEVRNTGNPGESPGCGPATG